MFEKFGIGAPDSFERKLYNAIAEELDEIYAAADYRAIFNPDLCPRDWLPVLAEERCVDVWDSNWPDEVKRDMIREWPKVLRHKGSLAAMKWALAACGYSIPTFHTLGPVRYDGSFTYSGTEVYWDAEDRWAQYSVTFDSPMTVWQGEQVREILERTGAARNRLNSIVFVEVAKTFDGSFFYDGVWSYGGA